MNFLIHLWGLKYWNVPKYSERVSEYFWIYFFTKYFHLTYHQFSLYKPVELLTILLNLLVIVITQFLSIRTVFQYDWIFFIYHYHLIKFPWYHRFGHLNFFGIVTLLFSFFECSHQLLYPSKNNSKSILPRYILHLKQAKQRLSGLSVPPCDFGIMCSRVGFLYLSPIIMEWLQYMHLPFCSHHICKDCVGYNFIDFLFSYYNSSISSVRIFTLLSTLNDRMSNTCFPTCSSKNSMCNLERVE